jgi:large subunit ribosomal protein L17
MRHRKSGVKLGRTSSHRQAMFRNMVTSLLKHGRIKTTDVKAKELRRWADHIVTLAKRGDLHARRQALSIVREKVVVHKLFDEAPERFGAVSGGYTRIIKVGRRAGDAAPMSLVELVRPGTGGGKPAQKAAAPMEIETPDLASAAAPAVEADSAADVTPAEAEAETPEASAPETGEETPAEAAAPEEGAPESPPGEAPAEEAPVEAAPGEPGETEAPAAEEAPAPSAEEGTLEEKKTGES